MGKSFLHNAEAKIEKSEIWLSNGVGSNFPLSRDSDEFMISLNAKYVWIFISRYKFIYLISLLLKI